MQRCTFLLKVCQYYDFACNLRLFATFRHSAAIARCRCRVAHFPEVIATTYMNMVTTLRNISHAKNLTAGDGWCHLAISRVCLHSEKGVGLNPYAPSQSLAHEARVTNKQRATMAVAFSSYQTEEATRTRRQGILHTTSPASATGENAFISMISARANSAAAVLN